MYSIDLRRIVVHSGTINLIYLVRIGYTSELSIGKIKRFIDIGFDKYQCNELFPNRP
jgi:hypothetical protein